MSKDDRVKEQYLGAATVARNIAAGSIVLGLLIPMLNNNGNIGSGTLIAVSGTFFTFLVMSIDLTNNAFKEHTQWTTLLLGFYLLLALAWRFFT